VSHQRALAALLREHNPGLSFRGAVTLDDLVSIEPDVLHESRLVAFNSGVVVPAEVLAGLGHGAYHFHAGPSDDHGWARAHFAQRDDGEVFGATAQAMTARVDSAPIIGVESLAIPDQIAGRDPEHLELVRVAHLFWRLSRDLACEAGPLPALLMDWSTPKGARRMTLHADQAGQSSIHCTPN